MIHKNFPLKSFLKGKTITITTISDFENHDLCVQYLLHFWAAAYLQHGTSLSLKTIHDSVHHADFV